MGGLYSALNISKNALLAFQTAVHVTSHNVANVDTEGYCRQKVVTTPYPPTPSVVGPLGSGVKVEQVKRYFDAFLEASLNLKRSDLGLIEAEDTGLDLIQGLFNETNTQGLASMLSDFFTAWQGLSNRAEGLPERRVVVEKGQVLAETVSKKYQDLLSLQQDVQLKLKDVVGEINDLVKQIAELNRQITAAESGLHQANDLRDQRDRLVAELSKLAQVRYFENGQGAYAVVLGKGLNLVDIDGYWQLELSGDEVYWVGHNGEKIRLTSQDVSQGKLGGWLRIVEQISEDWNHEYVISTKGMFTQAGRIVREDTSWEDLGLHDPFTIKFSGKDHFGNEVQGSYSWDPSTDPQASLRDFLDAIERAYDYQVKAYITEDGRLVVKDGYRGHGELIFQIDQGPVDFGTFDDENANHRVAELNLAGKFQLFAQELIRAVNQIHTEGVGLKFYEGELQGVYQAAGDGKIKALPFFTDIKRDGSFFLWLKDPQGEITPVKVNLSLTPEATMQDVADQINNALKAQGFDPEQSVEALFRDGRLVFHAQEGWGFAFSNDTADILMATGINVFFTGWDAGSMGLNETLSVDPEYVAAARLDQDSWRSDLSLVPSYRSRDAVDPQKTFDVPPHKLFVRFFDAQGQQVLLDTGDDFKTKELSVDINTGDTVQDVLDKLNAIKGLRAYLDADNHVVIALDHTVDTPYAAFELGVSDPPPVDNFLSYIREKGTWVPEYLAAHGRQESTQVFSNPQSVTLNEGGQDVTITLTFLDAQGRETGHTSLTVPDGTALGGTADSLVSRLNALPEIRAGFTQGDAGKLYLALEDPPEGTVSFKLSVSGGDGNGALDLSNGEALTFDPLQDRQIFSGLEPLWQPQQYVAHLENADPQDLAFSGWVKVRFFDAQGQELSSTSLATNGSPDITVSDTNGNGQIDLEDLVSALDQVSGISAYLDHGDLVVHMTDGPPKGAAYFVLEGNDPARSWGTLSLTDSSGQPVRLSFDLGSVDNWLFDQAGNPIDADPHNATVDPFRIGLSTDQGVIQIVQKYNAPENAKYGLAASLDDQGRLVVKTSGLYDTRSFVVTDSHPPQEGTTLYPNHFDAQSNTWFYLSDAALDPQASFPAQTLTLYYRRADGTSPYKVELDIDSSGTTLTYYQWDDQTSSWVENHQDSASTTAAFSLDDLVSLLNDIDFDQDGTADFTAAFDASGRLAIRVNDADLDNDNTADWARFNLESTASAPGENVVTYLARHLAPQVQSLSHRLQGFSPQAGDNRNALRLADLSNERRAALGEASVSDYYDALVGEVGIAGKSVKNTRSFLEDLVNQLQTMRDSISAVSLDEEMANLMKYQQAFAASAKILTVADEMLDTLIASKR